MSKATGVYKGFETKNGFITAIIEDTGLESSPGKRTKWFNAGKATAANTITTASGTRVEFEYTSKDHENGNTYYSIKGKLKELEAAAPAASGQAASSSLRGNDTNSSIEKQVVLKAAVEYAVATNGDLDDVVKAFKAFLPLLQPQAAAAAKAPPKPKPIEEISQDPDDQLPY